MDEYHRVASIIFLNKDGKFILQKRDDKPDILNPGMVTAWGGAVEGEESVVEAALRETKEETNLRPTLNSFEFYGEYKRGYKIGGKQVVNHVFFLRDVNELELEVYEGQGYEVVDPRSSAKNPLFTDLTNEIIADYIK